MLTCCREWRGRNGSAIGSIRHAAQTRTLPCCYESVPPSPTGRSEQTPCGDFCRSHERSHLAPGEIFSGWQRWSGWAVPTPLDGSPSRRHGRHTRLGHDRRRPRQTPSGGFRRAYPGVWVDHRRRSPSRRRWRGSPTWRLFVVSCLPKRRCKTCKLYMRNSREASESTAGPMEHFTFVFQSLAT